MLTWYIQNHLYFIYFYLIFLKDVSNAHQLNNIMTYYYKLKYLFCIKIFTKKYIYCCDGKNEAGMALLYAITLFYVTIFGLRHLSPLKKY